MSRVVMVTGGSSGLGWGTAAALAAQRDTVIVASRDPIRGQAAVADIRNRTGHGEIHYIELDLASFSSIRRCAAEVARCFDRLDVLVNNAGVMLSDRQTTTEGYEMTFGVNHLGHFLLTALLLDRLIESAPARVVTVSSILHRFVRAMPFGDLQSERFYSAVYAYSVSKLANVLFSTELARRLEGTGVTSNSLEPGMVRTGLDRGTRGPLKWFAKAAGPLASSPETASRTVVYLAAADDVKGVSGGHFVRSRPCRVGRAGWDAAGARRLWETSERLVATGEQDEAARIRAYEAPPPRPRHRHS